MCQAGSRPGHHDPGCAGAHAGTDSGADRHQPGAAERVGQAQAKAPGVIGLRGVRWRPRVAAGGAGGAGARFRWLRRSRAESAAPRPGPDCPVGTGAAATAGPISFHPARVPAEGLAALLHRETVQGPLNDVFAGPQGAAEPPGCWFDGPAACVEEPRIHRRPRHRQVPGSRRRRPGLPQAGSPGDRARHRGRSR